MLRRTANRRTCVRTRGALIPAVRTPCGWIDVNRHVQGSAGDRAHQGKVPLAGTSHLYRAKAILWPEPVQSVIRELLIPSSLHVCSGHCLLCDIRVDADSAVFPDVVCDAARLPFPDQSFNSVLCDPPYNGRFQWNHDVLSELSRVARKRVIFQHWFIPSDRHGRWRKFHKFRMAAIYAWQPKTYFGRAHLITVFDALDDIQVV